MASSLESLIRDLKTFEDRKVVLKEFRKEVRKPVPKVRKAIRARAIAILPHSGGLGAWVAKSSVTVRFKLGSRSSGITLKGSRKSLKNKSDVARIDKGRVRAPTFGHRGKGSWHSQSVTPGWFTKPVEETDVWIKAAEAAVDKALEVIARG